jgi:hypothetical protein
MRYSHALLLSFPLGYLIRIMWNHPIYAKLIISQCCVREVALLRISTHCFGWRRASINSIDVHFSAARLRTVTRSKRKILTYDSYSAAVFPWDWHVAKAKLSETRPCRAAPRRTASRRVAAIHRTPGIRVNRVQSGQCGGSERAGTRTRAMYRELRHLTHRHSVTLRHHVLRE